MRLGSVQRRFLVFLSVAGACLLVFDQLLAMLLPPGPALGRANLIGDAVFVAVAVFLSHLYLNSLTAADAPPAGRWFANTLVPLLVFLFTALGLAITGGLVYSALRADLRGSLENQLRVACELKIHEIGEWFYDRRGDAQFLAEDSGLARDFAVWLGDAPAKPEAGREIRAHLESLARLHGYQDVALFDRRGGYRLGSSGQEWPLALYEAEVRLALRDDEIRLVDFHQRKPHGEVFVGMVSPLRVQTSEGLRLEGAVLLIEPAEARLFPLLRAWPTAGQVGETLLTRREGERVRLINLPLPPSGQPLSRSLPLNTPELPAAMIWKGHSGFLGEVRDLDGQRVFAYARLIPGSPWALATKLDATTAYAPLRRMAWISAGVATLLLALSAFVISLWWRSQRIGHQAQLLGKDLQNKVLSQQFDYLAKFASDAIVLVDENGHMLEVNSRMQEMYGYAAEELVGQPASMLRAVDDPPFEALLKELREEGYFIREGMARRKDGSVFPVEVSTRRIEVSGMTRYQGVIRDISERKKSEAQIEYLAHYDLLTGLPNRKLLQDRLEYLISVTARREGANIAVLYLDVDRFKIVNDTLGHKIGDQVLKEVARRLRDCVRSQDTIARVGGDEFALVLPDETADGARQVAEKIIASLRQPCSFDRHDMTLSASIGIAIYPDNGLHFGNLMQNADTAMYRAKQAADGSYQFFTQEMHRRSAARLEMEYRMRRGMESGQFQLYYQPQVSLSDGRIIGAEALARWRLVDGSMVPPSEFIPVAEESKIILPLGAWILEEAIRQTRAWQLAGLPAITMSVNLSVIQMRERQLIEQIDAMLSRHGLSAEQLELEVTESVAMKEATNADEIMRALHAIGVRFAIDDFGTGYSSLSYLKRLPVSKLKVDASFVRGVPDDAEDAAIAETIIQMGRTLDLTTIAEGVETRAQLDFLRARGCDSVQGYYFSRPVPADEFESLLRQGSYPLV